MGLSGDIRKCLQTLLGSVDNSAGRKPLICSAAHLLRVNCAAVLENQGFPSQPSELSTAPKLAIRG